MPTALPPSAREVYQVLKDVALGVRHMRQDRASSHRDPVSQAEPDCLIVEVDGWKLALSRHSERLKSCQGATAPDGRIAALDDWQRYGTNPVDLLSAWEHAQLDRTLNAL